MWIWRAALDLFDRLGADACGFAALGLAAEVEPLHGLSCSITSAGWHCEMAKLVPR